MKKSFVAISCDLGAMNTGVCIANYQAGATLDQVVLTTETLNIKKDNPTLIMTSRTQKRHQRRGFDRRQMAKKLLMVIWKDALALPWNNDIQQALSYLMNRRGYSFLATDFDKEVLAHFPKQTWQHLIKASTHTCSANILPEALKNRVNGSDTVDAQAYLMQLANSNDTEQLTALEHTLLHWPTLFSFNEQTKKLQDLIKSPRATSTKAKKVHSNMIDWLTDHGVNLYSDQKYISNFKDHLSTLTPNEQEELSKSLQALTSSETLKYDLETHSQPWKGFRRNLSGDKLIQFTSAFEDTLLPSNKEQSDTLHLEYLFYAIRALNTELKSGARHRTKYFDEVLSVLTKPDHKAGYLKALCDSLQSGAFKGLTPETLANLIGHISNLERKPLSRYFDDKSHIPTPIWDAKKFRKTLLHWIRKSWRVSEANDGKQRYQDYGRLKKQLDREISQGGDMVAFMLKTQPSLTIPPYQNQANRRPPRCQSLVLDPLTLSNQYPDWRQWTQTLTNDETSKDYLAEFESEMLTLTTGQTVTIDGEERPKQCFSQDVPHGQIQQSPYGMDALNARTLHYILDRSKAHDPFKLNEIYSITKRLRQSAHDTHTPDISKWQAELQTCIANSALPEGLKSTVDFATASIFAPKSFLHFVCRYYKLRHKARDNRLFFTPKLKHAPKRGYQDTGRFEEAQNLLKYCNHKPRRKFYQRNSDCAAVLGLSKAQLSTLTSPFDHSLEHWLTSIKGIKTCTGDCHKALKDYRNDLKQILTREQSRSSNHELIRLDAKVQKLAHTLASHIKKTLNLTTSPDIISQRFNTIFSFAQLYAIALSPSSRSGNASTCTVCSADNAQRMITSDDNQSIANAQRLPAMPSNIIDGAVKKLLNFKAKHITETVWPMIALAIKNGRSVRIPIITESNQFEFEPAVRKLKGKSDKKAKKRKDPISNEQAYDEKFSRIREASAGLCPYTGSALTNKCEYDHIEPRSGRWGTLNDEANLIACSLDGNKSKGEKHYTFHHLNQNYLDLVFSEYIQGSITPESITDFIIKTLGDGSHERFKFGRYINFLNLTATQQVAFRHTLFLPLSHPLRQQVIHAINHKTKTFVNGTQRYFAEVLSNTLIRKALKEGHTPQDIHNKISFDYFSFNSRSSNQKEGIYDVRRALEAALPRLNEHKKIADKPQTDVSHIIDAKIAFTLAASQHRNNGGMKINIGKDHGPTPFTNFDSGEYLPSIFEMLPAIEKNSQITIKRQKSTNPMNNHRAFTRDTLYGQRFLPLLLHKYKPNSKVEVRRGFSIKQSETISTNGIQHILNHLDLFNHQLTETHNIHSIDDLYIALQKARKNPSLYLYITVDKEKFNEYCVNHFTKENYHNDRSAITFLIKQFMYVTTKVKIDTHESPDTIKNMVLEHLNKSKNFKISNNIVYPGKNEWEKLLSHIEKYDNAKSFFTAKTQDLDHKRTRREYSLPIITSEGKFVFQRKSWTGCTTYQLGIDADPRQDTNRCSALALSQSGEIGQTPMKWILDSGMFRKTIDDTIRSEEVVSHLGGAYSISEKHLDQWIQDALKSVPSENGDNKKQLALAEKNLPRIISFKLHIENVTAPKISLTLKKPTDTNIVENYWSLPIFKPSSRDQEKDIATLVTHEDEHTISYHFTSSGFNKDITKLLQSTLSSQDDHETSDNF